MCLVFAAAGLQARRGNRRQALAVTRAASLLGLAGAALCFVSLALNGPTTSPLAGVAGLGLSFRLDPLSVMVFGLIVFVGFLVLEYSRNYLAGNDRQPEFMGNLALTLAAALLMTTAGNLLQLLVGWVSMSLALHRLLVFFADRRGARIAANKKFLVARLGDACLAAAAVILWQLFGTADIGALLAIARDGLPPGAAPAWLNAAAALIALAAILKSAQFPTHGWIVEVMETPTPVSALLHAGIVNAGGFLVFRFADVIVLSPGSLQLLMIVGGFTALFGSLVMSAQTSIKVSLAYSTVAQMGFMLLQCGFGAFSSAGLHLVAHSLYKAHSFLASGTAVDQVRTARAVSNDDPPGLPLLFVSLVLALSIFVGTGTLFEHEIAGSLGVQTLGASFIMGLFIFLARGASSRSILLRVVPVAAIAAVLYFALQIGSATFFAEQLPPLPAADGVDKLLAALVLASFAAVTVLQIVPAPDHARWYRTAWVHLNNGLYANAVFNRLTGAIRREPAK